MLFFFFYDHSIVAPLANCPFLFYLLYLYTTVCKVSHCYLDSYICCNLGDTATLLLLW